MKHADRRSGASWTQVARVTLVLSTALAMGCSELLPAPPPPVTFYALEGGMQVPAAPAPPSGGSGVPAGAPTLVVSAMQAAPGFDSPRIVFVREAQQRESFALSEWVDTPARMLVPLIVTALATDKALRSVVAAGGAVSADLRLDTELVRLQQNFSTQPSRVRLTLRATLVNACTLRVIAWREFDVEQPAMSRDARGGVLAADQAVRVVLGALRTFCAEVIATLEKDLARAAPNCRF